MYHIHDFKSKTIEMTGLNVVGEFVECKANADVCDCGEIEWVNEVLEFDMRYRRLTDYLRDKDI